MTTWIALLRGVNVGGITIRSSDLAAVFRGLGFRAVKTVLASGNVRFETDDAASALPMLKRGIEVALRDAFGYDAWIVLVTLDELEEAIEAFPFDPDDATRQPWVVFCSDGAAHAELASAEASVDPAVDPIAVGPGVVYWNPVKGTSVDTPFAKLLAKARFRATTTNRNLRTLLRIVG